MISYEGYTGLWALDDGGYIRFDPDGQTIYDELGRIVFSNNGKDPADLIIEEALAAKDARLGRADLLP